MLALGKLLDLTLAGREPTEKIQLTADGTRLHWLAEGALEVTPIGARDNGVDLLLSAGIHGNETAPIELLERLIRKVAAGTLKPAARVLFLFGNPEAIRRGERYVEQDMNRLFNGRHEEGSGNEGLPCRRAGAPGPGVLQQDRASPPALRPAYRDPRLEDRAVRPLPWAEGRQHSRSELARLRDAGIEAVLLQNKPGITFSAYTYGQLGAEAFTLELGKARPFGENQEVNLERLERSLELLIDGSEEQPDGSRLDGLKLFSVSREVIKHSDHFRLHLDDDVANFTELSPGYLLAEDIGGTRWVVDEVGARIIFPNPRVKNGLRAGILVVPAKL